eukprot:m.181488 g.181488  ORF g.181488 m.181488 type:complete len:156 (-) comp18451_c1_seq13:1330-1797(-)
MHSSSPMACFEYAMTQLLAEDEQTKKSCYNRSAVSDKLESNEAHDPIVKTSRIEFLVQLRTSGSQISTNSVQSETVEQKNQAIVDDVVASPVTSRQIHAPTRLARKPAPTMRLFRAPSFSHWTIPRAAPPATQMAVACYQAKIFLHRFSRPDGSR